MQDAVQTEVAKSTSPASAHSKEKASLTRTALSKVTSNLLRLGAVTLEKFLDPSATDTSIPQDHPSFTFAADQPMEIDEPVVKEDEESGDGPSTGPPAYQKAPPFILHQVCSQIFGNIDPIQYEIIEENGKDKKKCILTITRPNGSTRSYATEAVFSRKAEAKAAAAATAVDLGALDFIKNGAPDYPTMKKGLVLAPLDTPSTEPSMEQASTSTSSENEFVKQIEQCCVEWRAGRVRPHWVQLYDTKPGGKVGCALRIRLSLHSERVYSVSQQYDDFAAAQAACAEEAIDEDLLEFIKHGNGQTQPAHTSVLDDASTDATLQLPPAAMSLQGFFESLPRPFPEPIEGKTASEINAPSWLNVLIQSVKGTKITLNFIWILEPKYALHGAVLRVERPGECKSFLVDPQFPKRADAKAAVCLVGMSQGIGDYIRECGKAVESKISPEMRSRASEGIMPMLSAEYSKIWPGKLPDMYKFERDKDAYGCTLTLKLAEDPQPEQIRTWTAPADYSSKTDAKVAVVTLAFDGGAIEFLRFRGEPPPADYVRTIPPAKRPADAEAGKKNKKRKSSTDAMPADGSANTLELGPRKRQKVDDDAKSEASMASSSQAPAGLPPKPAPTPADSASADAPEGKPKRPAPRKADRQQPGAPRRGRGGMPPRPRGRDGFGAPEPGELRPPYRPYGRGGYAQGPRPDGRFSDGGAAGAYNNAYASQPPFERHPRQRDGPANSYYDAPAPYAHGRGAPRAEPYYGHYGADPAARYDQPYPHPQPHYDYPSYPAPPPGPAGPAYYVPYGAAPAPAPAPYPYPSHPSSGPSASSVPSAYAPQARPPPPASRSGFPRQPPSVSPPPPRAGTDDSDAPRTWVPGPGYAARQKKSPSADTHERQSSISSSTHDARQSAGAPDGGRPQREGSGSSASGVPPSTSTSVGQARGKGKGKEKEPSSGSGGSRTPSVPRAVQPKPNATLNQTSQSSTGTKSSSPDKSAKSYRAALIEYCSRSNLPAPRFSSKEERGADGAVGYKPAVIMGKEKLELPGPYADRADGEERLALQVLKRMRAQAKKAKA